MTPASVVFLAYGISEHNFFPIKKTKFDSVQVHVHFGDKLYYFPSFFYFIIFYERKMEKVKNKIV